MDKSDVKLNPWHPITNAVDIKTIGKFIEELGECISACARMLIQGIDEKEPVTGKINRNWTEEEIGDILAGADLVIERYKLDVHKIQSRRELKKKRLREWHKMA